jgi:hypothetical protein
MMRNNQYTPNTSRIWNSWSHCPRLPIQCYRLQSGEDLQASPVYSCTRSTRACCLEVMCPHSRRLARCLNQFYSSPLLVQK